MSTTYTLSLSGGVTAAGTPASAYGVAASERVLSAELGNPTATYRIPLSQRVLCRIAGSLALGTTCRHALTIHPAANPVYLWCRALAEIIHTHQTSGSKGVYKVTLAQVAELAETLRLARLLALGEHLTAHQSQRLGLGLALTAFLRLSDPLTPLASYHQALAQEFLVGTTFARAIAEMLTQALAVSPVQAPAMWWGGNISQNLALHDALANTLVLVLSQDFDLDDEQIIRAIYQGDALLDGVNLGGVYVTPSGDVTTWAVNTRTNAVTEYTNYGFNSFSKLGTRYIAASETGVYELVGDDDDGVPVIADIISGYLQLNATKLSGLKGVYIAMRGAGDVYLKLITGDARAYTYKATIQPGLMTSKINIGKGLNARYITFQLTTTGQDFDLDTLEFVPMLRSRRV